MAHVTPKTLALALLSGSLLLVACDDSGKPKPAYSDKTGKPPSPKDSKAAKDAKASKATKDPAKASKAPKDAKAPAKATWSWTLPEGIVDAPKVPADNPMSAAKVKLGHQLFMDKRLSVDGTRSCYSCHQNHLGNADGLATAVGAKAKALSRNSPTIWNVGLQTSLYWDGRAPTLEKQAIGALKGGNMGLGDTLAAKAGEIGALPEYKAAFTKVFALGADQQVAPEHVAQALSAYERTLLCGDSAWDKGVLDEAAKRGADLFFGAAGCGTCHTGATLSDGAFHVVGIAIDPKNPKADVAREKVSKDAKDKYAFKTPTLRNVSRTPPYFHNGSVATLEEAVKIMSGGGTPVDGLVIDEKLRDVKLTDAQQKDIVLFLRTLDCAGKLEEIGDQSAAPIPVAKG